MPDGRTFYSGLQALRGLAFLLVFISHSGDCLPWAKGAWGAAAVSVFFVLSGFLSLGKTRAEEKEMPVWRDSVQYLWRKLVRFWPVYSVGLLLSLFFVEGSVTDFVRCLFLLQSYWGDARVALSFNWPSWFLSSMLFCYLVSPMMSRWMSNLRGKTAPAFLMAVIWLAQVLWAMVWIGHSEPYGPGYYWVYVSPFARVLDYAMGGLLAMWYARRSVDAVPRMVATFVEVTLAACFGVALFGCDLVPRIYVCAAFWSPFSLAIVVCFAANAGRIVRWLGNPVVMFVGKVSFEAYILHRMVLIGVSRVGCGKGILLLVLSLGITLAAATLCHVLTRFLVRIRHHVLVM